MKIGQSIEQPRNERIEPSQAERTRAGQANRNAVAASTVGTSDTVALSSASRSVAGTGNDIDATKVAQVRQAIEQGSFKVDAARVADRMIEQSFELMGRTQGA